MTRRVVLTASPSTLDLIAPVGVGSRRWPVQWQGRNVGTSLTHKSSYQRALAANMLQVWAVQKYYPGLSVREISRGAS